MNRFFGRQRELDELNTILSREGAQLLLVYGRRQVGKTTLLLNWARQAGWKLIYWVATHDTPAQVRRGFTHAVWTWAHPGSRAVPRFDTWPEIFETAANLIGDQRVILIIDQFSYAAESDSSLPSNLQAAWDYHFKGRNIVLVLVGSHIGMMLDLMGYDAPLYGRVTAQIPVDPLPFAYLSEFLPDYSPADRVAVYAVTGGVPAYLERFAGHDSVAANVQRLFMRRTGMFRNEPLVLISEVIRRETRNYEAILKAIASGKRTPQEIGDLVGLASSYLSPYLKNLEDLRLVERRIPATTPLERRQASRISQYHLADPYLHFYFRFVTPNLGLVEQDKAEVLWRRIAAQFDTFVGETAFQSLCREWVLAQAQAGQMPFLPEIVGSHWSAEDEVDVVAINWEEKAILLGTCHWSPEPTGHEVLHRLLSQTGRVVPDRKKWQAHYVVFSQAGFTAPAEEVAAERQVRLVDLNTLDADLRAAVGERATPEEESAGEDATEEPASSEEPLEG